MFTLCSRDFCFIQVAACRKGGAVRSFARNSVTAVSALCVVGTLLSNSPAVSDGYSLDLVPKQTEEETRAPSVVDLINCARSTPIADRTRHWPF